MSDKSQVIERFKQRAIRSALEGASLDEPLRDAWAELTSCEEFSSDARRLVMAEISKWLEALKMEEPAGVCPAAEQETPSPADPNHASSERAA